MVNIYTASYDSIKGDKYNDRLVSISGDRGKGVGFKGECFPELAPKKEFWTKWHNRKDPYSIKNIEYYIREYYKQVLSSLNPEQVAEKLRNKILLCYEPNDQFCHRTIFGYWIELTLGVEVPEIEVSKDCKARRLSKLDYVKDILEKVMKENMEMGKYHCIKAVLLCNKAEILEKCAIEAMDDDDSNYSLQLSLLAKEYRENASRVEEDYNRDNKELKKVI